MTKWLNIALGEVGVQEIVGNRHTKRVLEYGTAAGYSPKTDEVPWCGTFIAWVTQQAGLNYQNVFNRAASSKAWLDFGKKLDKPIPGAYMIYNRGNDPSKGHINLFVEWVDKKAGLFKAVGGNQKNRVGIDTYSMKDVVGIRWPKEVPIPSADQPLHKSGVIRSAVAALLGFFGLIAENTNEIVGALKESQGMLNQGTVLSAIAAGVIIAGLIGVLISRAKGQKDEKEIRGD